MRDASTGAVLFLTILLALWTLVGIRTLMEEGIVYGALFILAGFLGVWAEVRKRTPAGQEELATEEGLVPLFWSQWAHIATLGTVAFYGLYVVRDESAFLLLLFAVHLAIKALPQLFGEEDEARNESTDSREQKSRSQSAVPVEGESIDSTPFLSDEETVGLGIAVGVLVYAVGWTVVIPNVFGGVSRPSNATLTLGTGIVAVVAYGLAVYFIDGWVNVVVDQDRVAEQLGTNEERRAYRVVRRYWFGILVALVLALFVIATEVM